jgi:probable H4MPT-linked C1 transfer pathway protein
MSITVGLDVGGAHLKVARAENGRPVSVAQIVCPLWQGMTHLDAALDAARPLLARADRIGITMTGELSDLFRDRREGVETLVAKLRDTLGPEIRFWMGDLGFGDAEAAVRNVASVASTNFLASAHYVASRHASALFIDMGSTTTDIVAITGGHHAAVGLTDADRLATGELVYTGLTRTAVMGVTTRAAFGGKRQGLCREYLATMADVRRILGDLPDGVDQHATADGRGKSLEESIGRLARMFGRDAADGTERDWRDAARQISDEQLASIEDGCRAVALNAALAPSAPLVVAGIGARLLAEHLAPKLSRDVVSFGKLAAAAENVETAATYCAPAVAVALLQIAEDQV